MSSLLPTVSLCVLACDHSETSAQVPLFSWHLTKHHDMLLAPLLSVNTFPRPDCSMMHLNNCNHLKENPLFYYAQKILVARFFPLGFQLIPFLLHTDNRTYTNPLRYDSTQGSHLLIYIEQQIPFISRTWLCRRHS